MRGVAIGGFMGTGKSTVGPLLAGRLELPFVDLDQAVEDSAGCSIVQIFSTEGEEGFRTRELAVLCGLVADGPKVLALGGGTLHNDGCREALEGFRVVILRASLDFLRERVRRGKDTRPLSDKIEDLFRARQPGYQDAGVGIRVEEMSPEEVVDRLVECLEGGDK